jgi:hypothetical protein
MTDAPQWDSLQGQMAVIWHQTSALRAAIAADEPLVASEWAYNLYLSAHPPTSVYAEPARAFVRRALESVDVFELHREGLSRALAGSDQTEMRDAVDLLAALVVDLEPSDPTAYALDILQAVATGVCHKALYVAATGEKPEVIAPAARCAASEALERRRLRELDIDC